MRVVVPHLEPLSALVEIREFLAEAVEVLIGLADEGVVGGDDLTVGAADSECGGCQTTGDVRWPRILGEQRSAIHVVERDPKGVQVDVNADKFGHQSGVTRCRRLE